jgi:predicted glycogen debranching enzyme
MTPTKSAIMEPEAGSTKPPVLHRLPWSASTDKNPEPLLDREWLVTNGLGGYASGTLSGACTRRYHGLLIAALPAPLGRYLMFNHLTEEIKQEDRKLLRLDNEEVPGDQISRQTSVLGEFRLEMGLPVWRYEVAGVVLEKRILLPYLQNTVYVIYRLLAAPGSVRLRLRPSLHFRPHDAPVSDPVRHPYALTATDQRIEIHESPAPPLRIHVTSPQTSMVLSNRFRQIYYRAERMRGYEYEGTLWSPGYFRADLHEGEEAALVASTENWETILAVDPRTALQSEVSRKERLILQSHADAREGFAAELVLATDQFVIRPTTRVADVAVAHAAGDDVRTVIAGYHWFTDWGRDTMIGLEGLTLATGRQIEAGYILRTFGRYVRDGLIPNLFPEGEKEGLYHTADATLWFFHALERYLNISDDWNTIQTLLPALHNIVEHHLSGTHFGIRVDPKDGLLTQGAPGYQLTWMDAKVGDWVVTPRRGKAVEINALWYNALRLLESWSHRASDDAAALKLAEHAERARASFNRRFWFESGGYLYDVVDGESGEDTSLRPNQVFAISLDHPVLDQSRWKPVMEQVTAQLLTPFGLRSLSPNHPDYKATYDGDLRARDAAYHQGTVWAWLIGPYIDAWQRVFPYEKNKSQEFLSAFGSHLNAAGLGSISEIFDAEQPFTPRGCIAQAWSVAEVLRSWLKTTCREAATK